MNIFHQSTGEPDKLKLVPFKAHIHVTSVFYYLSYFTHYVLSEIFIFSIVLLYTQVYQVVLIVFQFNKEEVIVLI